MPTRNEIRYSRILTGTQKNRKCVSCGLVRRTTNRENPYVCEIDLRTVGRDLLLWRIAHSWMLFLFGVFIGMIIMFFMLRLF